MINNIFLHRLHIDTCKQVTFLLKRQGGAWAHLTTAYCLDCLAVKQTIKHKKSN